MKAFHVGIVLGNFPLLVSLGPHLPPNPAMGSHKAHCSLESLSREKEKKILTLSLPEHTFSVLF